VRRVISGVPASLFRRCSRVTWRDRRVCGVRVIGMVLVFVGRVAVVIHLFRPDGIRRVPVQQNVRGSYRRWLSAR